MLPACVCADICSFDIMSPYFHNDTVNAVKYLNILREVVYKLENSETYFDKRIIFQQDDAPCHFARDVRKFLDDHLKDWISHAGKFLWPLRSPDLTPCDFSMRGLLKDTVYKTKICTVEHLQQRILEEFEILSSNKDHMRKVVKTVKKLALACIEAERRYFKHKL